MTTTSALLAELQAVNPDLTFDIVAKAETAYADDAGYAGTLIGVLAQDVLIVDPFTSSCGRFSVNPEDAYGLPEACARQLLAHNCTPTPTSSTPTP